MAITNTISVTLVGSIASVSLVTLARSDTNVVPQGVTLPLAFANQGAGVWSVSFVDGDTTLAPWYFFGYTATPTVGATVNGSGSIQGVGSPATGVYTNQTQMIALQGSDNILSWSNVNASDTGGNIQNIQLAIDRADVQVNYAASTYGYATPITAPSCLTYLQEIACDLAICELYLKRGIRDSSSDAYGQFQNRRREAFASLRRIFKNRINDADRLVKVAPFVVLDPSQWADAFPPIFLPNLPAVVP